MKIIIDARFLGTETGIGRYVKEVVEGLEKNDYKNQYIIYLRKENYNLFNPVNTNFFKKQVDIKWYSFKEQLFLGRLMDKENADLIHFPHFNVPIFCKTPFVFTLHDLILRHFSTVRSSTLGPIKFYLKYLFYNFILKRALIRSKKIIVPSFFVRNDVIKTFNIDPDKISVVYGGLANLPRDINLGKEYLFHKGIKNDYILYVGNTYPHKNIEKLIETFVKLKKEKKMQLVLVGKRDFFSKRIELWAKNKYSIFAKKYPEDIIFYGYATDEELVTLYKNAKIYVFPSLMEGFGLPPLEALSFGLPVVCSNIPAFHEVLGDKVSYFNPYDSEDIKNVIIANLEKSNKYIKIDKCSWSAHVNRILEIYSRSFKRKVERNAIQDYKL